MNQTLYFTAPGKVEIRSEPAVALAPDQVQVETAFSAISHGTEMLLFRGQAPSRLPADETIAALHGDLSYPLKFGYAAVGKVQRIGSQVDRSWKGKTVFAFNPHQSSFCTTTEQLIPIPARIKSQAALFLPNMESALGLVMDARPLIGERVVVFGQGIVGLLTTALLRRHPLARLVSVDPLETRRQHSLALGAHASLDPTDPDFPSRLHTALEAADADLAFELSGNPAALDAAIGAVGYDGRVIIGSWYGDRRAAIDLGGEFHRQRIRLISSQVSSLDPGLRGRWDKIRRLDLAWEMIRRIRPQRLITQRIAFENAADAYRLIDQDPAQTLQVILGYR